MRWSFWIAGWMMVFFPLRLVANPPLEVPVPEKSFGAVISGAVVQVPFEVVNHGSTEVVVKQEPSGCACVSADATTISAKGRGSMIVRFDTVGRRGYQTQTLRLKASNQSTPLMVTLEGNVLPPFRLAPQVLRLALGVERRATVEIHGPLPFHILSCSPGPASNLTAECLTANEAPVQELIVEVLQESDEPLQGDVMIEVQAEPGRSVLHLPVVVLPRN